jgi:hypothetical protein
MAAKRFHHPVCTRTLVLLAAVPLLVSTVCMLGYARAFAARSALDQQQIGALKRSVPAPYLPENSILVPVAMEERLFAHTDRVDRLLVGVFERPWSAGSATRAAYRRPDLSAITGNRWAPLRFEALEGQTSPPTQFRINSSTLPVQRTVLFTYRDGRAFAIERLTLSNQDGSQHTIDFPIAGELRRGGIPTIDSVAVPASS